MEETPFKLQQQVFKEKEPKVEKPKRKINSKQKGKRGELAFAQWLRETFNIHAIRGVQYAGSADSPDVVGIAGVHIEVKNVENLNVYKAMAQARRDCATSIPIVAHKKNRTDWHITLEAKDWKTLSQIINMLSVA